MWVPGIKASIRHGSNVCTHQAISPAQPSHTWWVLAAFTLTSCEQQSAHSCVCLWGTHLRWFRTHMYSESAGSQGTHTLNFIVYCQVLFRAAAPTGIQSTGDYVLLLLHWPYNPNLEHPGVSQPASEWRWVLCTHLSAIWVSSFIKYLGFSLYLVECHFALKNV